MNKSPTLEEVQWMNASRSGKQPIELLTKYKNRLPVQATIKAKVKRGLTQILLLVRISLNHTNLFFTNLIPKNNLSGDDFEKVCNFQDRHILLSQKQAS